MTERRRKKTKLFTNDMRSLLYAFGDVQDPLSETVDSLEDVLINFIVDTCHDATNFARVTRRQKIKVDDFAFSWRRDPVKYGRVFDLLRLQEDIKEARKQFDNSEGKSLKGLNNVEDDDAGQGDLNDDEGENAEDGSGNVTAAYDSATSSQPKKGKKSTAEPERKKRKYTKSGKERKPYKKRAKKGEQPTNT
jgi:transcription initiation factor TFIID subunit 13